MKAGGKLSNWLPGISDYIVSRHNIKSFGPPSRKVLVFLQLISDDLGPKQAGLYIITCEWDKVYIGPIGHSTLKIEVICSSKTLVDFQWTALLLCPRR
jgi:hypothetical protein